MRQQQPMWTKGLIAGLAGIGLFAVESKYRLRTRARESRTVRTARNLTLAAMAGIAVNAAETPLAMAVARRVEAKELGLMPKLTRSPLLRLAGSIALLDYGLYVWHVLTHKVPLLWKFHMIHHVDLDMDASTALRFHFGEMLLSVPWRVAQIRVAGATPAAVSAWQTFLFVSILFHHSNVRLPVAVERVLRFLIMTPRLHGIHHRPELTCTNSNWSSGLAIWDLFHRTWCWREDDNELVGVPGYDKLSQVTLGKCITMPFRDVNPGYPRPSLPGSQRSMA